MPSTTRGRRPTQADVARLAEVSQPVVSYVLSGDPEAQVAPETRRRVLAAIEQLGYVPDRAARSLRRGRTSTVAAVLPDITNPFYPAFERGLQDTAEAHGYDLISYNTDGEPGKELAAIRSARGLRVDGLVITPFHVDPDALAALVREGVAVVVNGEPAWDAGARGLDQVFVDNVAAAAAAVDHLIDRGHARIGMLAGPAGTPPRENRVRGYLRALAAHHLPLDPVVVRSTEVSVDYTVEGGHEATSALLRLDPRPTAIFAANDLMAMGALIRLREAGIDVPGQMAVVGFDDIPAARLVHPALTTVAQHPERIGRRCAQLIVERLAGPPGAPPRREGLPFDLVVRDSA